MLISIDNLFSHSLEVSGGKGGVLCVSPISPFKTACLLIPQSPAPVGDSPLTLSLLGYSG